MDKNHLEVKKFLEEQIQWCKEQDRILEEMDVKLHQMKSIAVYAIENELTQLEIDQLNSQLNELNHEVHSLEKQLYSDIH